MAMEVHGDGKGRQVSLMIDSTLGKRYNLQEIKSGGETRFL